MSFNTQNVGSQLKNKIASQANCAVENTLFLPFWLNLPFLDFVHNSCITGHELDVVDGDFRLQNYLSSGLY